MNIINVIILLLMNYLFADMPRGRGGRATSSRGYGTMGYCDFSTSEDTDIPSSVAASSSHAAMSLYDDHDEHRADRDDEEVGDDIVQEDAHPRRGRGVNRGAEISKSPSERPMITLIGESKRCVCKVNLASLKLNLNENFLPHYKDFSSIQATRDLMPDMRRFCEGAWAEWKDVPTDTKQFMFERFSVSYFCFYMII
ncbi:hypothetical protein AXF42_Ash004053 [Apostasia shenzhenica]|uniref:Uncharacterized protein n=1 Tax=Apostasia shenzhenica TaxID=1088818 RepID=A0A2I0A1X0_9ASPA|nr:hypothetical protein AXF42_Ash004053 [Apostasia shenzhenica]